MTPLEVTRDKLARRGLLAFGLLVPGAALLVRQHGASATVVTTVVLIVGGFAMGLLPVSSRVRRLALPSVFGFYVVFLGLPSAGFLSGPTAAAALACTFTTLLYGRRAGFIVTAVMVAALLVSGYLYASGVYTLIPGITDLASVDNWMRTGIVLAGLSLLPLQAMLGFVQEISYTARSRAVAL